MSLLQKIVEIESYSGQEQELAQFLCDVLGQKQWGFRAKIDSIGNVIAQIGQGTKQVFLVGHMDTVPGKIPVRVENGKLYGRGSVDAKGCLANFIESAKHFAASDKLTLTVVGCVGEEGDSHGAKFLLKQGYRPDYIVIGEPSGWEAMTLGYKGSLRLNYELRRPMTHRGHEARTAPEEAFYFFSQLKANYSSEKTDFNSVNVNLTAINTSSDGLSEDVHMSFDIRTPLDFEFTKLKAFLDRVKAQAHLDYGPETHAYRSDKNNPLVRSLLKGIRAHSGQPTFKLKTGTSDMNLLGPAWQVPIVAYGPGDSSLDHTPNEHLDLAEYERAQHILTLALRELEMGS
jgi:LysW-gamma-L-lysine carboxypeptidase